MRRTRALWLALMLLAGAARAAFEDTGAGARAPGLGNAFTAMSDDLYAVYYNPAGLAQLERPQLGTAYARLFMGLSDNSNISSSFVGYAQPLKQGRRGTLGAAWNSLSLNSSLYREDSLYLSYGRRLLRRAGGSELMGGLSVKYLRRSFGGFPEASNALDSGGLQHTGMADPDMAKTSKTAYDADLGFLYRFPKRLQLGLAVRHFMQPDVGFAGADKLPRRVCLAAAWKSLWMSLTGEAQQQQSPSGKTDRDFILAAERYFPSLNLGQFGLRGSLGFGSRNWQQLTTGLGYRVNKLQLDYGFLMPLGTVSGTAGSHRMSLTWHFGAPTPDEEITQDLLDQARQLREGRASYGYEYAAELRPQSLDDPRLAEVRSLIEGRRYRQAHQALSKLIVDLAPGAPLVRLANRLELVSHYYPDWSGPRNRWETIVVSAIYEFLHGRDRKAVLKASYAWNLSRSDAVLDHFLAELEGAVGVKALRLPPDNPRGFVDQLLAQVEAAESRGEAATVDETLRDLVELGEEDVTALEKVGSMCYVLGRYQDAVDIWSKALSREKSGAEIERIRYHMDLARRRLGGGPGSAAGERTAPPAGDAARKVERLFQKGVEHYGRGEYIQATAAFMRILELDPQNSRALKALDMLKAQARPQAQAQSQAQPQARPPAPGLSPEQMRKLYVSGVDHYAAGEYEAAKADFEKILAADPGNEEAKKALLRVREAAR